MFSISNYSGGYTPNSYILKGIDATLSEGSMTAIIGPNGAGKSTLLKAMLGMLPYKEGNMCYASEDIQDKTSRERARIIAVSTSRPSITNQSVCEYCLMGRTAHRSLFCMTDNKTDYNIALKAMQTLGIEGLEKQSVSKLSDGQRQLASIARALTQEPKVLLLDEPTANLDPANQQLVLSTTQKITHEKRIATIIVLHDINHAAQWTDNIIMMKDGKIMHMGETATTLRTDTLKDTYGIEFEMAHTPNGQNYFFPKV